VTVEDELIDLLDSFGAAFSAQDLSRLRALFDEDDLCFVASDSLALHDRAHLETFLEEYSAQPTAMSFEWDACQASTTESDVGWVVAFGRQIRHEAGAEAKSAFRLTLVGRRRADGWRIAHVHASAPLG
jgi:ketosteroid isomerase-like protein